MNNLHRELAHLRCGVGANRARGHPYPQALSGRAPGGGRAGGKGDDARCRGHGGYAKPIDAPAEGVQAVRRAAKPVVELCVPFTLTRAAIDDVERGSEDSDWQPLKDAARKIAYAGPGPAKVLGRWCITEIIGWDADDLDMLGPSHIQLGRDGGAMAFGAVQIGLER